MVQGGKKLVIPPPTWDGLPKDSSAITPEFCDAQFTAFGDHNRFKDVGGFDQLNKALGVPMVLVMSIWDDVSSSSAPRALPAASGKRERFTNRTPIAALLQHALA